MFNWSNMGKFIAVGLPIYWKVQGLAASRRLSVWRCFLFLMHVYRQRFRNLVDSGPIFVPMFMLLGFHPAFAQILFVLPTHPYCL